MVNDILVSSRGSFKCSDCIKSFLIFSSPIAERFLTKLQSISSTLVSAIPWRYSLYKECFKTNKLRGSKNKENSYLQKTLVKTDALNSHFLYHFFSVTRFFSIVTKF